MMNKAVLIVLATMLSLPIHAASGNAEAGKAKSTACAACHGADGNGNSNTPMFPKLAGQHRDYLYHSLKAYKTGKRKNPIMAGQVQNLSVADMEDLAAYYSKQKGLVIKY